MSEPQTQPAQPSLFEENIAGTVKLIMIYRDDTFQYGTGDDEIIDGRKGKILTREEAERVLELGQRSNAQILMLEVEGDDANA